MNLPAPSIRPDDCDELSALCKAGGDPLRLNVLRALANDSFGVLELTLLLLTFMGDALRDALDPRKQDR